MMNIIFKLWYLFFFIIVFDEKKIISSVTPSSELSSHYIFHPFYVDNVFVIVVETKRSCEVNFDPFYADPSSGYLRQDRDSFLLSFGDENDRDEILSHSPEYIYKKLLHSKCYCSKTLLLSLVYLDMFLGGENGTNTDCQSFTIHDNIYQKMYIEVFGHNIISKIVQWAKASHNIDSWNNFYFASVGFPQEMIIKELNSHDLFENLPAVLSENTHHATDSCPYYGEGLLEKRNVDYFFDAYTIPECNYPSSYCCFLLQHDYRHVAAKSRCIYHPNWKEIDSVNNAKSVDDYSPQQTPRNVLEKSVTGNLFYLEEVVEEMVRDGIEIERSIQWGKVEDYSSFNVSRRLNYRNRSNIKLELDNSCIFFAKVGLNEFIDFGVDPIPSFRNEYIHIPSPLDVKN